ncbi:MAG TPA: hydroxyacylglutathione hydrolase [Burkholderiaceae bacterium]
MPVPSPARAAAPLQISPLPAFRDNYIWLIERGSEAAVVDPGDAAPVEQALRARGLTLTDIVVTHHHPDHVGGVAELAAAHGSRVLGPAAETIPALTVPLQPGGRVEVLGETWEVIGVPGHTRGHIAYWCAGVQALLCGDTLFACGCGRLFEGTPAQMSVSLAKLAALPGSTRVYCAHEYTLSNIRFAQAVEPGNAELEARRQAAEATRARNQPTVPSTIALELATNPFLRCDQPAVRAAAEQRQPGAGASEVTVLAAIRGWKDVF